MARREIPAEHLELAGQLLAEGKSQREVSRQTGISTDTLSRRFPRTEQSSPPPPGDTPAPAKPRRDPPPRPRRRAASSKTARRPEPTDAQLEDALRVALKMCAVPMRVKCDYCAAHMNRTAAATAADVIQDEDLRRAIAGLYVWCLQYAGAGRLALFLGVPMLHHLAPDFIYRNLAVTFLGMPPRDHHHHHEPTPAPPPASNGTMPPPAATQADDPAGGLGIDPAALAAAASMFGGMDLDQLIATAEGMGMSFDPAMLASILQGADGNEPESEPEPIADEPADSAESELPFDEPDPAAVAAEAAVADSDAELGDS